MKRSRKRQDEDIWEEMNNLTKNVTGSKASYLPIRTHWFIGIIATICTLIVLGSTFLISLAMQSAFNMGEFNFKLPEESIVVDMNKLDMHTSDKSLRVPYFEEETIEQVLKLVTDDSWLKNFLPASENKYDFTFYRQDGTEGIDSSLVQTDGFVHCNLKIKLKNLPIEFELPVISQITNTAKFYEKFMMFNQYEGHYSRHISGTIPNPGGPWPPNLQEKRYQGYLPSSMYFTNNVTNFEVYQSIEESITKFTADYAEEFAPNTHLFPILSTIPLGDIDINDPASFPPYFQMINTPNLCYIDIDKPGTLNKYVNLQNLPRIDQQNPRPFYISYVSNPDVINDLIDLRLTTSDELLINYFTHNPIDYMPFSNVQKGEDVNDIEIPYTPSHTLYSNYIGARGNEYNELVHYFANSNSITNNVETIRATDYANIDALTTFLETEYWQSMFDWLIGHKPYFRLVYPVLADFGERNWQTVIGRGVDSFKQYFIDVLNVTDLTLTTFTFLDSNHNPLTLLPTNLINPDEITNFRFDVGQDLVSNPNFAPAPHSFSFFFNINWT
ncbi:hypothetical protein [Spiroplasma endosymbiont of Nebria brevicollis]|uniref:hypothetical protein n=1 Tax=Spiroplasma endosymbiont of Nebria brevicollis TaxID=3066284 RepID=UPI00313A88A5